MQSGDKPADPNQREPRLLVHILAYRRPELLRRCCESVARTLPPDSRVLVWLNGPQPENESWLAAWRDPRFEVRHETAQSIAAARSVVLRVRPAEFIYYLDDDVVVCEGTFDRALATMRRWPDVAVLGGPNLTPPGSSWLQRLTTALLASRFTAPGVFRRYRRSEREVVDVDERSLIFCNLLVRVAAVPPGLAFESSLRAGEETLWLCRLASQGGRLAYRGDVAVFHERRRSFGAFLKQLFFYGYGRAQQSFRARESIRVAFLVPALVVAILPWGFAGPGVGNWGVALSATYVLLTVAAFVESRRHEALPWWSAILFPFVAVLGHLSYGLGFWRGLVAEVTNAGLDRWPWRGNGCFGRRSIGREPSWGHRVRGDAWSSVDFFQPRQSASRRWAAPHRSEGHRW